jgi:signal transduction histidine kinase
MVSLSRLPHRVSVAWTQNLGLQRRIMLYVAIGLVILIAGFAFFALRAVNRSSEAILQERLALAQTVARDVDSLIASGLSQMERMASLLFADPLEDLTAHEESMLQAMIVGLGGPSGGLGTPVHVYLLDRNGAAIWEWGADGIAIESEVLRIQVAEVISGRTILAKSVRYQQDPPASALVLATPVMEAEGEIKGALIAALVTIPGNLALFVPPAAQAGEYGLELIDEDGVVVASSDQEHVLQDSRHRTINDIPFSQLGRGVWKHNPSREDLGDHIVALVPLESLPWTVALERKEDVALALPGSLRGQIFLLSAIGILAGLVFAWITTRQVVRPLTRLTATAGAISSGDLDTPVAIQGQDEARALSHSFEAMRLRLRESLEEVEGWNRQLEARVASRTAELEQRTMERRHLLEKVITAQEEERRRVARELHDIVGQALAGLGMALGSAEAQVGRDPDRMRELLESLRSLTSSTMEEVRRLIADLRPSVLDDLGLVQAVGWYVENYLEKAGIKATINASGSDEGVSAHLETALFRMLQEAITNIIKHSNAKNVSITLEFAESTIMGEVRDDGDGFEVQEVRRGAAGGHAVGLLGMEERMNLLSGSLEVNSKPNEGTVVTFRIPQGRSDVS